MGVVGESVSLIPVWVIAGLVIAAAAVGAVWALGVRHARARGLGELQRSRRLRERDTERVLAAARLGSDLRLADTTGMKLLLDRVAATIRPAEAPFTGFLGVLEGPDLLMLALTDAAENQRLGCPSVPLGGRIALAATLGVEVLAADGVVAWDDLAGSDILAARPFSKARRTRSAIGTGFRVGPRDYLLVFTSEQPAREAFDRGDRAYIELIAQLLAQRLQQRDQLDRLRFNAGHDTLTELANRASFRHGLVPLESRNPSGAMVVIDLDRFRDISQALGHQTADAIIVEISFALRRALREGESLARLGADVFAVFLPLEGEEARTRIAQIAGIFSEPFGTGDRLQADQVRVTASIGVAFFPDDAADFDTLLGRAEIAAELAKAGGRDRIAYLSTGDDATRHERGMLRIELIRALRESQLTLQYQPIVALAGGAAVAAEALVRWNHPNRGLLAPEYFVPFAEQNGLIGDIDRWALAQTLADLQRIAPAFPDLVFHINVSPEELREERFLAEVRARAARDPRLVRRVGIEVAEAGAMLDSARTDFVIGELRALGITTLIDGFGMGTASLARLKTFAVDTIKLDRSSIAGLPHDPFDAALVDTLLGLTRQLGVNVLAQGVERDEQLAWLRDHGVSQAQGEAIGGPMSLEALVNWLRDREPPGFGAGASS